MMKTPEEYFQERDFLPDAQPAGDYTAAERAFLEKYMGQGKDAAALAKLGMEPPAPGAQGGGGGVSEMDNEPGLEQALRNEVELQLVSFFLGSQEFTIPINVVQEVIRFMPPTKLPAAPSFMAGIVNLRGRVTPLVKLRDLLGMATDDTSDDFIIVCRRKGLQVGLIITSVATMYRVQQEQVDWNVESHVGGNVEFVNGIMKGDDGRIVGIVSVDRIVDSVLAR